MEKVLLLFSDSVPSWDEETLALAGEEPKALDTLTARQSVCPLGKGFVLTEKGRREREAEARELCVPVPPVTRFLTDEAEADGALERNRMVQLIDRAFRMDWGVKEIETNVPLPFCPDLADDEFFSFNNPDGEGPNADRVRALWPSHPLVRSFLKEFPLWDEEERKVPAPGAEGLAAWREKSGAKEGTLLCDLLVKGRYDFDHYRGYENPESDRLKLLNCQLLWAWRYRGEPPQSLLPKIGKFHLFLLGQRRIWLPGWFDLDSEDQENWILFTLVCDTEEQLETLTRTLRGWGNDLIEPAHPLFILGTSIERLRAQKEVKATICDWFQEDTVRIFRPDVPDEE